jgi:hypothetical protein
LKRFAAYSAMALAILIGGGSLLLFGAFLLIGPPALFYFDVSENEALLWDGLLSLMFFVQHSGMMRSSFRNRLASIIPRYYHPSIYAIASGIALTAVVLFWMQSPMLLYRFEGLFVCWLARSPYLPSRVFGGGCGRLTTLTHSVWLPSRFISAAGNSEHRISFSAVPISGSAILSIFSRWF